MVNKAVACGQRDTLYNLNAKTVGHDGQSSGVQSA
jgi:hypothetical protein